MTAPRQIRIRPAAEGDLIDIGRYTRRVWGLDRARIYLRAVHAKLQSLAVNPNLGVMRDDVAEGYRSAHVGRHLFFYRVERDAIVVVRVLHERMDARRHFEDLRGREDDNP